MLVCRKYAFVNELKVVKDRRNKATQRWRKMPVCSQREDDRNDDSAMGVKEV